jgi:hypothetical protein
MAWRTWLFSAPSGLGPPPTCLALGWTAIGAAVLVAFVAAVRLRETQGAFALAVALGLSVAIVRLVPTPGATALSVAPLAAILGAMGLGRVAATPVRACTAMACLVVLDWAALLTWAIPRLYLWH